MRGGYHQVGIFLSRLANLPRIVNISGLSLDSPDKKNKKGIVDANDTVFADFILTAYTLPGGTYEIESN